MTDRRHLRARLELLEDRSVPAAFWATGSDLGSPGTASLVDAATGQPRFTVTPFGAFTGGVRVAVGDVNGDTVPDLIAAAGVGGGPQVSVYSGANGNLLTTFFAFEPAYRGGLNVAAGDVNADTYADIIVASSVGATRVSVFDGKTGAETSTFFAFEPTFLGGVTVASADLNGDGRSDVIAGAGKGGAPRVRALSGATGRQLFDGFVFDSGFRDGVNVAGGDVNRDGLAEMLGDGVDLLFCNEEEALNCLFEGEQNRSTSDNAQNKTSSRSHAIFTIYLESRSTIESSEKVIHSKLHLVDLAGSERILKSEAKGIQADEAKSIN